MSSDLALNAKIRIFQFSQQKQGVLSHKWGGKGTGQEIYAGLETQLG